ncbi:MAG: AAA family ATPase [Candidatus Nanohaloarchaea archaeon]
MGRHVLVTGVAGSGKSSVCAELARRGYEAHDIEERDDLFTMVDPGTGEPLEGFDNDDLDAVKRSEWRCDVDQLQEVMDEPDGSAFWCGVAANMDELLPLFDEVVLLEVGSEELRERLAAREDEAFGTDPDVRDWLLGWKDGWEMEMRERGAVSIDGDRPLASVVDAILDRVER